MTENWLDSLQRLAEVRCADQGAISFYFQPTVPRNQAHREDVILVKDLIRDARHKWERKGGDVRVREALDRLQALGEQLSTGAQRAKAVFVCPEKDLWLEFDLPAEVGKTNLLINSRFHLKPMAMATLSRSNATLLLADREAARILQFVNGELRERERIVDDVPRRVRSDGFAGYDGGHNERHVDNEVMRHFKRVAERLKEMATQGELSELVVGCRVELWPELEPHLHSYVRRHLLGHFEVDPMAASLDDLRDRLAARLEERRQDDEQGLVREVIGEAQRNGRGSIGLKHVLVSLERGEVQTLLIGERFSATAAECEHCGHLDTRMVKSCAVCGKGTREVEDIADALVGVALRHRAEVRYTSDEALAANIGALLRFRSDRSTGEQLATG